MIQEYHRPQTIEEALLLLTRQQPITIPLAGGSTLQHRPGEVAVVDLQALGLNKLHVIGDLAELGAMVTFQQIMEWEEAPGLLVEAVHRSATFNLRNQVTLGGAVASAPGASPVVAALLALDARLTWQPGEMVVHLGEWLPLRKSAGAGKLITQIQIPLKLQTAMEAISRTPSDPPQIMVCGCRWPSGRIRLVALLKSQAPVLVSDGRDQANVELGSLNVEAISADYSEEYVRNSLQVLIGRVIKRIGG